jgi:hypothetical protein
MKLNKFSDKQCISYECTYFIDSCFFFLECSHTERVDVAVRFIFSFRRLFNDPTASVRSRDCSVGIVTSERRLFMP